MDQCGSRSFPGDFMDSELNAGDSGNTQFSTN